jgi:hypothetical protein
MDLNVNANPVHGAHIRNGWALSVVLAVSYCIASGTFAVYKEHRQLCLWQPKPSPLTAYPPADNLARFRYQLEKSREVLLNFFPECNARAMRSVAPTAT